MMLETAADTGQLAAVVSEGAGARTFSEEKDNGAHGLDKALGTLAAVSKTASIALFSNQTPPESLKHLSARIEQPALLIAAPNSGYGEELSRDYARAAGDSATLWEIPESGHVGGIRARPEEYERRVIGFFDAALAR